MIGAIVGDIVGSIYEFDNIKTKDFPLFGKGCTYTDDSILTIAIADALLTTTDLQKLPQVVSKKLLLYARTFPYPMGGYGSRFVEWVRSGGKAPYNSCGNGSAMRASACGYVIDSLDVEAYGKASAIVTHNHLEGIKGAEATAAAIFLARTGVDKDQIRKYIQSIYYPQMEEMTLDELRPTYSFESTCQKTFPQAFVAFYESTGFEDAIRNGISLGGDSDTLCAITGAIAEAYYGVPNDIREKALSYLPSALKNTVLEFEKKFPKSYIPQE